jgi:hypothetical protein
MSLRLKSAAVGLTAAAMLGGLAVAAQPAGAAGTCGSGYGLLDSYPINKNYDGSKTVATVGSVSLYYSSSAHKNCAITRPISALAGNPYRVEYIGVYLQDTEDGSHDSDASYNYSSYAGPVYTNAVGHCVTVTGAINVDGYHRTGGGYVVHCG